MTNTNSNASLPSGEEAPKVDYRKLIQTLRERIWLVLAITVMTTALGAFYALKQTHIFRAKATIQVEEEQAVMPDQTRGAAGAERNTLEVLNTTVGGIKTSRVLARVAWANNLLLDRKYGNGTTNLDSEQRAVKILTAHVEAKLRPATRYIDIYVEHPSAAMAQKIANSVATNFIYERLQQKMGGSITANEMLNEQSKQLKEKLKKSETELQKYKQENDTISFEDRENLVLEKVKEFNASLHEAKNRRLALEADLSQIKKIANDPQALLSLQSIVQDPAIIEMRKKVVDQEAMVSSMTNRYKEKYPKMINAQQQLAELRNKLNETVIAATRRVESDYSGAVARERNLEQTLAEEQKNAFELQKKAIEYHVLSREYVSDQALFEQVLKRIKETDLQKEMAKANLTFTEAATLPTIPYKPDRKRIVASAFILGLLASLGLVYFLNQMDTSIRTVDDAERNLRLPVLGAIPVDKSSEHKLARLVMANEPHSLCAEAFRSLRASIGLLGRGEQKKVILFTSAVPAEGKTFSCVNYAICQGQQGVRVLLIDFDLRRPAVGDTFSMPSETPGVTSYLLGKDTLKNLVQESKYQNVFVLPAGPQIPNPAEQLETAWVSQLIAEATTQFDRVIIDTAPLNAVSDTTYLLKFAQIVNMVVRSGKTPEKAIQRAIEMIRRAGSVPTGIILNHLPQSSGYGYYYYYSSKDGYKSNGVYGAGIRKRSGVYGRGVYGASRLPKEEEAEDHTHNGNNGKNGNNGNGAV